jgi:hypothetical protein
MLFIACNEDNTLSVENADKFSSAKTVQVFSIKLKDQFSGLSVSTASVGITVEVQGDVGAVGWCMYDLNQFVLPPLAPVSGDGCFNPTRPTTITLGGLGPRTVYLYTKDISNNVSLVVKANITYVANQAPLLVKDIAVTELNTPVTIIDPLANDSDSEGDAISVTSVGTSTDGTTNLNGDGSITFTPSTGFTGEAGFTYTATDARGDSATGNIFVSIPNTFTWTGDGAGDSWHDGANWCGTIIAGACQGDGAAPGVSDIAIFNANCTNCNVDIDSSFSIDGIHMGASFTGTITQATGVVITVGDLDWIQDGGAFVGSNSDIIINRGEFILNGGSFTSTSADFKLIDFKGGYATHDYFTVSKTGLFNHNNGRVWFHLNSSNYPTHSIKITGTNSFYDVLVKRDGGSTDDVKLSTATSPSPILIERNLDLENIAIMGNWNLQGNIYYGAEYGTYQGSESAQITFSGNNNQSISVNSLTSFSTGDVSIDKTGGSVSLLSNTSLNTAGQDLTILSATTVNLGGFNLTINNNLNAISSTVITQAGGVLTYGTWNGLGTINP